MSVTSIPDGADIEVDGAFMRNAPSTLELSSGDHVIMLKNRYRGNDWLEMSAQVIVAQPLDRLGVGIGRHLVRLFHGV